MPLEVFHLLLGWPCHFDRKTQNYGETNTYSFVKDNMEIVLKP